MQTRPLGGGISMNFHNTSFLLAEISNERKNIYNAIVVLLRGLE